MVEDRITDAKRIAQLLASEFSGRDDGPLGDVTVVDADRDAVPSPDGTLAYGIGLRGARIANVVLYPEAVEIELVTDSPDAVADRVRGPGLACLREDGDQESTTAEPGDGSIPETEQVEGEEVRLRVEYGAAVKRTVDALVAGLDE